jgi:Cys-tRNA synthase (O-phospho-L-seryl-tRNA:Cys-tRNA synthase)
VADTYTVCDSSHIGMLAHIPRPCLASFASDHDTADVNAYLLRRMSNGVPEGPNELIAGTSLPLESCMDVMGGGQSR